MEHKLAAVNKLLFFKTTETVFLHWLTLDFNENNEKNLIDCYAVRLFAPTERTRTTVVAEQTSHSSADFD